MSETELLGLHTCAVLLSKGFVAQFPHYWHFSRFHRGLVNIKINIGRALLSDFYFHGFSLPIASLAILLRLFTGLGPRLGVIASSRSGRGIGVIHLDEIGEALHLRELADISRNISEVSKDIGRVLFHPLFLS